MATTTTSDWDLGRRPMRIAAGGMLTLAALFSAVVAAGFIAGRPFELQLGGMLGGGGTVFSAAGTDLVALDQASVDLVNAEPALSGTKLTVNTEAGGDKFKGLYPNVEWRIQLKYAEKLGLGSRSYELLEV